jgi:hypothetical protein
MAHFSYLFSRPLEQWPGLILVFMLTIVGVGINVLIVTFIPAAILIRLAENFSWRALWIYLASGAALGTGLGYWFVNVTQYPRSWTGALITLAASGTLGGLVYWAIAGRKAGVLPET